MITPTPDYADPRHRPCPGCPDCDPDMADRLPGGAQGASVSSICAGTGHIAPCRACGGLARVTGPIEGPKEADSRRGKDGPSKWYYTKGEDTPCPDCTNGYVPGRAPEIEVVYAGDCADGVDGYFWNVSDGVKRTDAERWAPTKAAAVLAARCALAGVDIHECRKWYPGDSDVYAALARGKAFTDGERYVMGVGPTPDAALLAALDAREET